MSRMCARGSSLALRRPLAVLACLALLCGAAVAAAGCDTEELAKPQLASSLPFTVDYQRSGEVDTTTFYFKVCAACPAGGPTCQPLKAFRVRLADAVLAAPKQFIQSASPAGTVESTCAAGPGWWLKDVELGVLSEAPKDDECELFEVTVFNQGGKTTPLSAICQQSVVVKDAATGDVAFDQATSGASCMFVLETADGSVAVGALKDAEKDALPAPPPHRATPSHPITPAYYYGASAHARRLSQAPFTVRSLLTAYYGGYNSHRRLSSAVHAEAHADSAVVFATRRLMEASFVPLPRHLQEAARVPSHLTGGRQLSSYYYQGAATTQEHRRSLQGLQPGSLFRRTLTTYYYGAGVRRSLMNVGQDAILGTAGRTLSTYYYGAGHRRSLMSAGARTLNTYYYGSHRRMLSVGQEATLGGTRSLQSYGAYYASGHRRSLMSSNTGRTLTTYYYGASTAHRRSLLSAGAASRHLSTYYYGGASTARRSLLSAGAASRHLSTYYYGGASTARRSLLSAGAASRHLSTYYYGGASTARKSLLSAGAASRHLSTYYYGGASTARRSLLSAGAASRHLSTYYYGGASTARRSLLSAGTASRRLSTYYYGGASTARRSLLSAGASRHLSTYYYGAASTEHRRSLLSASRHLSTYYYGGASTAQRRLMSVGQEAVLGRSLLHSGYGYYGQKH